MSKLYTTFRNIVLFGFLMLGLSGLGLTLNILIPWAYLTDFFILIRHFLKLFDFLWDTTTLFTLVGIWFLLESALMFYRATLFIVGFFRSPD